MKAESSDYESELSNLCYLRRVCFLVLSLTAICLLAMLLPIHNLIVPRIHYIPLHTVMELVSVFAAFLVFATIWHTPSREISGSLVFLAVSLLASGWLDIAHTLSLTGMPDFITPSSPTKSILFWLAARFMVASNLLAYSFFPNFPPYSNFKRFLILALYCVINLIIFWIIVFHETALPVTFVDGIGVTPFKVVAEYSIVVIFAVAAWRIFQLAKRMRDEATALLFGAASTALLSELILTDYMVSNSAQHIVAHILKIVTYVLVYRALFVGSIKKPYQKLALQTKKLIHANTTLRIQALALTSTTTPVMVTDSLGNLSWRNPASAALWSSLSKDETNKLNIFSSPLTPDALQAEEIRSTLQLGLTWSGLVHILDSRGNQLIMDRTITPLRNETGMIEGYVSVSENRTENLRALSRHKRVLEIALDGFFIANFNGIILETNAAFSKLTGYSDSELVGMHISKIDSASEIREINTRIKKIIDCGYDRFETVHRHKEGQSIDVEIAVAADKESQHFFVFVRDITEKKKTHETTLALERQLQRSQKMQALGQLTGGIAHDFNNILTSILGYSNLALTRFVPDKQSKLASYLNEVTKASERARQVIEKLLTFARTERSVKINTIDPKVIIEEVISMIKPSIPSRIQLISQIESHSNIQIDEGELNQILVNLVINSRDAISGIGKICIRSYEIDIKEPIYSVDQQLIPENRFLALEVSDTGHGISSEHMPHLFEPFFTTKDVGKGTGLGLPMVHGIVRRSNGHVIVDSKTGMGARFQLLFPITFLKCESYNPTRPVLFPQSGIGQRIWVVDDESSILGYLHELLTTAGYQVQCFAKPSLVLDAFKTDIDGPDLFITDQTMPELSGIELSKLIHARRPDLSIILCSGDGLNYEPSALEATGITKVFSKPLHSKSFLTALSIEIMGNDHQQ